MSRDPTISLRIGLILAAAAVLALGAWLIQPIFLLDAPPRAQGSWRGLALGWGALTLLALLLAGFALELRRRLRELRRGMDRLAAGQRDVRLREAGAPHTARLMAAFNHLAQTLDEGREALRKCESRVHAIADYTYGLEAWFNPQGHLLWINRAVERLTGHTPIECLLAENLIDLLVFEKDRKIAREALQSGLEKTPRENFELRLEHRNGTLTWVELSWQPIDDVNGEYLGLRVSGGEIQARKQAELKLLDTVAQLRRTQALKEYYLTHSNAERARLEALLNAMRIGVLFIDGSNRLVYTNNACRDIWGVPREENLSGTRDATLIERTAALRADEAAFLAHLDAISRDNPVISEPFEIRLRDGRILAEITALVLATEKARHPVGRVWIYEDITHQKALEAQLLEQAVRDPLTGLFNRRRFGEEIDRVIAEASRRQASAGLLAIDLDGFKPINDAFGHPAGDTVLVKLAHEIGTIVRRNETFFRLGGDEFAILAPEADEREMIGLARRVSQRIASLRFEFSGQQIGITASLGIALYPHHAQTSEAIMACADAAMYRAKTAGKDRWVIHDNTRAL